MACRPGTKWLRILKEVAYTGKKEHVTHTVPCSRISLVTQGGKCMHALGCKKGNQELVVPCAQGSGSQRQVT